MHNISIHKQQFCQSDNRLRKKLKKICHNNAKKLRFCFLFLSMQENKHTFKTFLS